MSAYIALLSKTERVERNGVAPFFHLRMDYHKIPSAIGTVADWEAAKKGDKLFVRHKDVALLDSSRVRFGEPLLHASCVTVSGATTFAMQAPTRQQFHRFWLHAYTAEIKAIFMLTNFVEDGVRKADDYLPQDEGETMRLGVAGTPTYVVVTCDKKTEVVGMDTVQRQLVVSVGNGPQNIISHYLHVGWSEDRVPSSVASVHYLASKLLFYNGHAFVHGTAGVGRSGTLLLAAAGMSRARRGSRVRMTCLLYRLRRERALAVKGAHQLSLAIRVVLHDGLVRGHYSTPGLQHKLAAVTAMADQWAQEQRRERRREQTAAAACASPGEEEKEEEEEEEEEEGKFTVGPDDYPTAATETGTHCEHCC